MSDKMNDEISDEKENSIWQYYGYDNGIIISTDTVWRNLESYRNNACEYAYQNGLKKTTTNDGEYQFDITNMTMYVIDFGFVSPTIQIRRILSS